MTKQDLLDRINTYTGSRVWRWFFGIFVGQENRRITYLRDYLATISDNNEVVSYDNFLNYLRNRHIDVDSEFSERYLTGKQKSLVQVIGPFKAAASALSRSATFGGASAGPVTTVGVTVASTARRSATVELVSAFGPAPSPTSTRVLGSEGSSNDSPPDPVPAIPDDNTLVVNAGRGVPALILPDVTALDSPQRLVDLDQESTGGTAATVIIHSHPTTSSVGPGSGSGEGFGGDISAVVVSKMPPVNEADAETAGAQLDAGVIPVLEADKPSAVVSLVGAGSGEGFGGDISAVAETRMPPANETAAETAGVQVDADVIPMLEIDKPSAGLSTIGAGSGDGFGDGMAVVTETRMPLAGEAAVETAGAQVDAGVITVLEADKPSAVVSLVGAGSGDGFGDGMAVVTETRMPLAGEADAEASAQVAVVSVLEAGMPSAIVSPKTASGLAVTLSSPLPSAMGLAQDLSPTLATKPTGSESAARAAFFAEAKAPNRRHSSSAAGGVNVRRSRRHSVATVRTKESFGSALPSVGVPLEKQVPQAKIALEDASAAGAGVATVATVEDMKRQAQGHSSAEEAAGSVNVRRSPSHSAAVEDEVFKLDEIVAVRIKELLASALSSVGAPLEKQVPQAKIALEGASAAGAGVAIEATAEEIKRQAQAQLLEMGIDGRVLTQLEALSGAKYNATVDYLGLVKVIQRHNLNPKDFKAFQLACLTGDLKLINAAALEYKISDSKIRSENINNPLELAACSGKLAAVQRVLERSWTTKKLSSATLNAAARSGSVELVNHILEAGISRTEQLVDNAFLSGNEELIAFIQTFPDIVPSEGLLEQVTEAGDYKNMVRILDWNTSEGKKFAAAFKDANLPAKILAAALRSNKNEAIRVAKLWIDSLGLRRGKFLSHSAKNSYVQSMVECIQNKDIDLLRDLMEWAREEGVAVHDAIAAENLALIFQQTLVVDDAEITSLIFGWAEALEIAAKDFKIAAFAKPLVAAAYKNKISVVEKLFSWVSHAEMPKPLMMQMMQAACMGGHVGMSEYLKLSFDGQFDYNLQIYKFDPLTTRPVINFIRQDLLALLAELKSVALFKMVRDWGVYPLEAILDLVVKFDSIELLKEMKADALPVGHDLMKKAAFMGSVAVMNQLREWGVVPTLKVLRSAIVGAHPSAMEAALRFGLHNPASTVASARTDGEEKVIAEALKEKPQARANWAALEAAVKANISRSEGETGLASIIAEARRTLLPQLVALERVEAGEAEELASAPGLRV